MRKLKSDFECVPSGEIYPRVLAAGGDCPEELEAQADALGLLEDEAGDGAPKQEVKVDQPAEEAAGDSAPKQAGKGK